MTLIRLTGTGRPKNWREAILMLFPNGPSPLEALLRQCQDNNFDPPDFFSLKSTPRFQNETFVGRGEIVGFFAPFMNLRRRDVVLNERNAQAGVLLIHQRADGYVAMQFTGRRPRKYLNVGAGDWLTLIGRIYEGPQSFTTISHKVAR